MVVEKEKREGEKKKKGGGRKKKKKKKKKKTPPRVVERKCLQGMDSRGIEGDYLSWQNIANEGCPDVVERACFACEHPCSVLLTYREWSKPMRIPNANERGGSEQHE